MESGNISFVIIIILFMIKNAHYTGIMLDASTIALCPKLRCCNHVSNPNETPMVSKLLLNLNLSTTPLAGTEIRDCCTTMAIIGRYYWNLTPLFWEKAVHIFILNRLFYGIHVLYTTQSKYINETKTHKKCQQNTATKVKRVYHFCKLSFIFKWLLWRCYSVFCSWDAFNWLLKLWRGGFREEVKKSECMDFLQDQKM